jgi:hypothetical protein
MARQQLSARAVILLIAVIVVIGTLADPSLRKRNDAALHRRRTLQQKGEMPTIGANNDASVSFETPSTLSPINIPSEKETIIQQQPPVQVLLYETMAEKSSHAHKLLDQLAQLEDIEGTIFGEGTGFEGFGSKYSAVFPVLQEMDPNTLVVISDARDVLVNSAWHSTDSVTPVEELRGYYQQITAKHPGAIIVSAEAQCCVSALTYVAPGAYYNADGSRMAHSCASGEEGCTWAGDDKALAWESFMQAIALERTGRHYDDVYLNAGLMIGTAKDLLHVIELAGIGKDEDDQAVLTDFMYLNPALVLLDYGQNLFGNNRGGLGGMDAGTCVFGFQGDDRNRLVHSKTGSTPLFLHSPGKYFECQDDLAVRLGVQEAAAVISSHRRLKQINNGASGCNYGGGNHGGSNYGGGNYRSNYRPGCNYRPRETKTSSTRLLVDLTVFGRRLLGDSGLRLFLGVNDD